MDKLYAKFINLNFYLALLPFRINFIKRKNNYGETIEHYQIIHGHIVQRLFAGTLLALNVLQGFFQTHGAYWGKVVINPSVLFLIWKTLHNSLILGLFWGWTFWKRQKRYTFHKILEHLLKNKKINSINRSGVQLVDGNDEKESSSKKEMVINAHKSLQIVHNF